MNNANGVWNDCVGENFFNNTKTIHDKFNSDSQEFVDALNETIRVLNDKIMPYKSEKKEILELKATVEEDIFS